VRTRILAIAGAATFILTAIFFGPDVEVTTNRGPATAATPSPTAEAEKDKPSSALMSTSNPDGLLDEADLKQVTTLQFKRTKPAGQGTEESHYERSTTFEYKPQGGTPITLVIGTWIDDTDGSFYKELVNSAKGNNAYYPGIYTAEGDAGADAFISHDGTLTTRKGRVILRLVGNDTSRQYLNDKNLTILAFRALNNVDSAPN
jgi:hypothetical protein